MYTAVDILKATQQGAASVRRGYRLGCTRWSAHCCVHDWTVNVRWRCGLMSNCFDHLLKYTVNQSSWSRPRRHKRCPWHWPTSTFSGAWTFVVRSLSLSLSLSWQNELVDGQRTAFIPHLTLRLR